MSDPAKPRPVIVGSVGRKPPAPKDKIYLATPAYGSTFSAEYVRSLFMLLASRPRRPIEFVFAYFDYADITVSRNYLISDFYFNHRDCGHILFVDDDMGFDAAMVSEMLALNEAIVGTMYPARRIDLRKLHAAKDIPFEKALASSVNYIGSVRKPIERKGEFISVTQCGTGVMLISRACLDAMTVKLPELVDTQRFKRMPFGGQFSKFITPFDKLKTEAVELSEDFSFCKRWVVDCRGKIWAHTNRKILHAGRLVVESKYSDLD